MKTFKDLQFKEHPNFGMFNAQARIDFNNTYTIIVITGESAYTNDASPYEVAIMYKGKLTYSTPLTDDVIGYQTEDDVTNIMKRVQQLKD